MENKATTTPITKKATQAGVRMHPKARAQPLLLMHISVTPQKPMIIARQLVTKRAMKALFLKLDTVFSPSKPATASSEIGSLLLNLNERMAITRPTKMTSPDKIPIAMEGAFLVLKHMLV